MQALHSRIEVIKRENDRLQNVKNDNSELQGCLDRVKADNHDLQKKHKELYDQIDKNLLTYARNIEVEVDKVKDEFN